MLPIYLDCNASAAIDQAAAAMRPYLAKTMPNASFIAVVSNI